MSDQELNVDNIKVKKKLKATEFDIRRISTEPEKFCGECCWFYGEDTDGWGFCACQKNKDLDMMNCSDICTTDKYVSKKEMRHHMAVLLQYHRYVKDGGENCRCPFITDRLEAMKFAYRYMKVFSEL